MDIPTAGLALALRDRNSAHGCGWATIWRATVTLTATSAAGTARGASFILAGVWPASVIFTRVLPSAFLLVARRAYFFAITTAFTIPIAITVSSVWAFPITVRETVAVVSVSPAAVPVPFSVPVPTITTVAVAMVLARGAVTFRITVMMVRALCERERRKEVSTVLESCLLVEGAPVDW
jgi:hypothetical protein